MSAYAESLYRLQSSILARSGETILPLLDARPALTERFNVYSEGYRLRLIQAVLSDYPTLSHYLGEQRMEALVRDYVEATPSTTYTLDRYPLAFAAYVNAHAQDEFGASLAALESAIANVFWLPDSEAFAPPADLAPEQLCDLHLAPRVASQLLLLSHPAEAYLQAFREELPTSPPAASPSAIMVLRHRNEVKRHTLAPAEYLILREILGGASVGDALETVASHNPASLAEAAPHLQAWFQRWVAEGFFMGVGAKPL